MSDGGDGAKPADEANAVITIRVKERWWVSSCQGFQTGKETMFEIKKSSKISTVFNFYAQLEGVEATSLRFFLDGERIQDEATPKMLEMEDDDQIDCVLAQPPDYAPITFRVKDQTGEETMFKIKHSTKMSKVFNAYVQLKGVEAASLRFLLDGKRIRDEDTPKMLELEDDDQIDCVLAQPNARDAIERLLATATSPGKYCAGGELSRSIPVPTVTIVRRDDGGESKGQIKLGFPLDAKGVKDIKDNAERAGVGMPDRTVVNLDVRKTWQIKPRNLQVSNVDQALESALQLVSRELGTDGEYRIEASLYKLLLYEEGCFFARHRDNERLDGMFGTLVLELPSEYQGGELAIWSPLTPNEKSTFTFNGGKFGSNKRRTRSTKPSICFAAFYADCHHEVSKIISGHRVALVYHLTADPIQRNPPFQHLPIVNTPPQPADESVAARLSRLIDKFSREDDNDYPNTWGEGVSYYNHSRFEWPGKPKKLAVCLSHSYTPAALTGIHALKGSDRSIAELIRAAAFQSPDIDVASLARLAAKKTIESGGEQYAADPANLAHDLVSEEFKPNCVASGPFFDAVVTLARLTDSGEATANPGDLERRGNTNFRTTGPLISLTGSAIPFELGPPCENDRDADYHLSWFGGEAHRGIQFRFYGPADIDGVPLYDFFGPAIFGEQAWFRMGTPGNHSLPIYSHELLFASEEAAVRFRKDTECNGKHVFIQDSPKEVEFLGNGNPYPGRVYSRAVILLWPKAHREAVQMQTKGGRSILEDTQGQGKA